MNSDQNSTDDLGWYGKLPTTGDFLQRRLPASVVNHWAHWCHNGLVELQRNLAEYDAHAFSAAPVWNFIIPATLGSRYIQMGCMLPARDSVGRHYPICAMRLFTPDEWHPHQLNIAEPWYQQLGHTLLNGVRNGLSIEQFDRSLVSLAPLPAPPPEADSDILSIIGFQHPDLPVLSWQQAIDCFDPQRYASFWWSNQADGHPLYTHVHSGNLTVQLFSLLFDPAGWQRVGRGGQYPKMFE